MPSRTGWPREDREEIPARLSRWVRRPATDRAELGFLLFLSIVVPAGYYGTMFARGNLHEVVPQRVYRSAQPSPDQLRGWIGRYGLKTVVSLRGTTAPGAAEEKAVVASMRADMIFLSLSAHKLMPRAELVRLIEVLQTAPKPMLLHCQHGVDRAGTAAALAAWLVGGLPYERAKWQAYVPSGPWKHPKGAPHVSDTLAVYEDYCRRHALNPDDTALFQFWAREVYRPDLPLTSRARSSGDADTGGRQPQSRKALGMVLPEDTVSDAPSHSTANSARMGVWSLGRSLRRGSMSI